MKRAAAGAARLTSLALLAVVAAAFGGCSGRVRNAAEIYRSQCARCHGSDGKGDRRSLGLYPALDLTASPAVHAGARGRGLMYRRISEGYDAMPGFGDRLETAEIEDLIDYVLRLPQGKASR